MVAVGRVAEENEQIASSSNQEIDGNWGSFTAGQAKLKLETDSRRAS
jgi:hypothetical protein